MLGPGFDSRLVHDARMSSGIEVMYLTLVARLGVLVLSVTVAQRSPTPLA